MVYAINKVEEKRPLWDHIHSLKPLADGIPWIIMGYFNIIRNYSEKLGSLEYDLGAISAFNDIIIDTLDIGEFPAKGCFYTVCNKREDGGRLCLIQKSLTGQPSDENVIQLEKIVKMEYIDLLKAEEAFYRDEGRVEWLRAGDKNTKYFHRQGLKNAVFQIKGGKAPGQDGFYAEFFKTNSQLVGKEHYYHTIAMAAFTALFEWSIAHKSGFVFHLKCGKAGLSHLAFADDLFLLTGASPESFQLINHNIHEFGELFGLKTNFQKCQVFLAGTVDSLDNELCNIVHMPRAELLVKYLGLPLITYRLSMKDCQSIFSKIQNWENKKLSYGGRLQLIQGVLNRIHLYWGSAFILPKSVVRKIDYSMLSSFLRAGEVKQHYNPKVF
ncbi:uncharacterized protein [Coffea arabica]|uniref:Reverse transcriptase domain-containing protein n=1 Tax=Coffea arabica TaxID=13443 RepID=A0ABM4X7L1_COFAR